MKIHDNTVLLKDLIVTIYSEGAMNSIVADFISGLRCGSPYDLDTGSKLNSSGTEKKTIWYI